MWRIERREPGAVIAVVVWSAQKRETRPTRKLTKEVRGIATWLQELRTLEVADGPPL